MPNEFKMKHSSAALMAALAAAFPLTGHAAGAARVDFAMGDVKALAADGRSRTLAKGAEIESGEMIDTGSGRAQVRFSDGAQVSLAPQTQFRIDEYRFVGKADGSEKGFFSLLRGAMRTITGLVGRSNRDNYKVSTTVATIGIRGTEFSVTYGNSITVTTGEGSNEVCNAIGCVILNSGETAYVADSNTQPVLTDKKADIPPPPADGAIPTIIAGNNTNSDGSPSSLFLGLTSGPGYSFAVSGQGPSNGITNIYDGLEGGIDTYATFSGGGLSSFSAYSGSAVFSQGAPVGMLTDGIIGWGRWIDSTFNDSGEVYNMQHVHYVVGMPTPAADMAALGGMVGTYSLLGYTFPTATLDGVSFTLGTQPISGSMTADFGGGAVAGSLYVPMGANTYSSSWSGSIFGSSSFSGSGSVTSSGSDCGSGCNSNISGFFAGANAVRAGLVYDFSGTDYGTIRGAAAFKQTGLAPY